MMKKFFMSVLMLGLIAGLIAGCGESDIQKVEGDDSKQEKAEKKQETLKIGEAVKFDGLKVKLTGVREYKGDQFIKPQREYKGDQFIKPQNDKFVLIQLEIENTTDKPQTVSSLLQMNLVDAEGQSQDVAITGNEKGKLDGELGAGRKMKGEVAFDVMKSDKYEFIFDNPFTTGQAIWEIKSKDIKK